MRKANKEWRDHMESLHKEAAGILEVRIFPLDAIPNLAMAAMAGNAEANTDVQAISHTLQSWKAASASEAPLCVTCDEDLRSTDAGFSMAVVYPSTTDPSQCFVMGICGYCAKTPEELKAKAGDGIRRVLPDAREISVHPTAGRA